MCSHAFLLSSFLLCFCLQSCSTPEIYEPHGYVNTEESGKFNLLGCTGFYHGETSHFPFAGSWLVPESGEICITRMDANNVFPGDPISRTLPTATSRQKVNNNGRSFWIKHLRPLEFNISRKRWCKGRVSYYPNSDASFNFMALCIELSGDVHPLQLCCLLLTKRYFFTSWLTPG